MGLAPAFGLPYEHRSCHEQVFRLKDLDDVIKELGIPIDPGGGIYENYAARPFEMFIEVHVWSDRPVADFL